MNVTCLFCLYATAFPCPRAIIGLASSSGALWKRQYLWPHGRYVVTRGSAEHQLPHAHLDHERRGAAPPYPGKRRKRRCSVVERIRSKERKVDRAEMSPTVTRWAYKPAPARFSAYKNWTTCWQTRIIPAQPISIWAAPICLLGVIVPPLYLSIRRGPPR